MNNSICPDAQRCGSFNHPACTEEMRIKDCSGPVPLKLGSNSADRLRQLLPEPTEGGSCQICGGKNVKVYPVNENVKACENCYFFFVLPRNSMPTKQTISPAKQAPATV